MAKKTGLRKQRSRRRRLAVLVAVFILAGGVGLWRVSHSSWLVGKLRSLYRETKVDSPMDEPVRGKIYDRDYRELAVSLEQVSVYARARELRDIDHTADRLAEALGRDPKELGTELRGDGLRLWIAQSITEEQEEAVRALKLPGIYLQRRFSRFYPQKTTAAHLIGFAEDGIGLAGVECYYDRLIGQLSEAEAGHHFQGRGETALLLTVDLKIQDILEHMIDRLGRGRKGFRIGAYAMDAASGAVVAAAQYPSFDPNNYRLYSQDVLSSLLTRPMVLPPVFRTILCDSAAIQSQYATHGTVQAWSVVSNALDLGGELQLWDRLGFDQKPLPEFANEEMLSDTVSRYDIPAGEEQADFGTVPETLSPLKLLAALTSLVNGGKQVRPYVVEALVEPRSGKEVRLRSATAHRPEVVAEAVSREISSMIGSFGRSDELDGVTVSGTVHAGVESREGHRIEGNTLYFSAVPKTRAQLTLLLTVQSEGLAAEALAPQSVDESGRLLAGILPRIAVLQQVGKSISEVAEPQPGNKGNYPELVSRQSAPEANVVKVVISGPVTPPKMPELVGLSLRKSLRLLEDKNCSIRIYGTGRVVQQTPAVGMPLHGGIECVLRLQRQEHVRPETLKKYRLGKR